MEAKIKEDKNTFKINAIYPKEGQKLENVIESAFIKYLKYNEYIENK